MANEEQVKMLKQGVQEWNKWIEEHPEIRIDLHEANLNKCNLHGANLIRADLSTADLSEADLREAILAGADLGEADLRGANLREAILWIANFEGADLGRADLGEAELQGTNLGRANLQEADFRKTNLSETILWGNNLSETKGLEEVDHLASSPISTSTLKRSKGRIPEKFLRGCGLSNWEIESAKLYQLGLSAKEVKDIVYRIYDLRVNQAIQIIPLFISYSHKDSKFVDEMEKHLNEKGIRFWRDIHDATSGRLEKVVDQAMRLNPIVLLVLSGNSVKSDWVEHEARSARALEKELGRDVLCPVALDDRWKECEWPARVREQIMEYNILDFSKWKDEGEFGKMFRKLIDGLDLYNKE